ncbi:Secretory carrier-associated membrane protein 3 [Portunus trituberculatus]|uniref:Secretory carrier-associated membrane protein n=1 Tax=Portunus trituberculatus TaxID=210409 RepID=A0A5B7FIL3_PORTR|nr:Secretory carrier-associated membrane protein 3 [Portunus trituberculatus]
MGSKQSVEKPIESQSIITHSQQHYNTNTDEQSEQHFPLAEARILSNNLSRHIDPEDDQVYRVANYRGAASSQDSIQKSLKISFDRRDTSAPLALTLDNITRQDNWPPLPSICPVGPCFYQDINVDIPLEFQKIVRMLYYLWMCIGVLSGLTSINSEGVGPKVVGAIVLLIASGWVSMALIDFVTLTKVMT